MGSADDRGTCDSKPTSELKKRALDEKESDVYHEIEAQWRTIRDCESALEAPWATELVVDPRSDPRCKLLERTSIEAFAITGTAAGEGVFLFPSALSELEQRALLRTTLGEWAYPPNRNNLWPNSISEEVMQQGLQDFAAGKTGTLVERLRWVTLGRQYDWTDRKYLSSDTTLPLPLPLVRLSEALLSSLPLPETVKIEAFDAAICNFYHAARRPSDRLGGHKDDVEPGVSSPLVSLSLGLPCVFLLGGETRAERPTPILLRGGSVLVLAGKARQAYHGVPSVLVPPRLQPRGRGYPRPRKDDPNGNLAHVYCPWKQFQNEVVHCEVASMLGMLQRDQSIAEMEETIEHLLTHARVNFSIRSVGD